MSDGFHRIKQSTGDGFHQMKKVLMGKDQSVATQQFEGNSSYIGRLLFAYKLTSVQETQVRLYDELKRVLRKF